MNGRFKKALSILVASLIMLSSAAVFAAPVSSDISGHWASATVGKWVSMGLVSGYGDGSFKPDAPITRAEFAQILSGVFKYTEKAAVNFPDVQKVSVFYDAIAKVRAAGIFQGDNGKFRPNDPISRQEAAVVLAKAFDLAAEDSNAALKFSDSKKIASWSKAAVSALFEKGYVSGRPGNVFAPAGNITRAEAIKMIDNIMGELKNAAGTYTGVVSRNLVVNTAGVVLKDMDVKGDLYLTQGVGDGEVTLENVKVAGRTIVSGGGENSILIKNSSLGGTLIITKKDGKIRIVASGTTSISEVQLNSGAKLQDEGLTGEGFNNVQVLQEFDENQPILLDGNFKNVIVAASGINIEVLGGTIEKLNIEKKAEGSKIQLGEKAVVTTLTADAGVSVTGGGKIGEANINADGVTMEQQPDVLNVAKGTTATVGGQQVTSDNNTGKGNTPPSTPPPASNKAPQAKTVAAQAVNVLQSIVFSGVQLATDPDMGDTLSVSNAASDKTGIVYLSVSNGQLSIMGVNAGSAKVTATVQDNHGAAVDVALDVTVSSLPSFSYKNANFEADIGEWKLSGVNSWENYIANGALPISTSADAAEGSKSLMISNGTNGFTSTWQAIPVNGQSAMPSPGDSIQLGAWVKLGDDTNDSPLTMKVSSYEGAVGTELLRVPSTEFEKKGEWAYVVSNAAFIPVGASTLSIAFEDNKSGTVLIDDVKVYKVPSSTISPVSASFEKTSPADIPVTVAFNGNTLSSISNGGNTLVAGTDYSVSGETVTIAGSYLAAQPVGTTILTFVFSQGAYPTLSITITDPTLPSNSTINPTTASFNKNALAQADVTVSMTLNGNTLSSIKNGDNTLTPDTDYTASGNTVVIKKEYLAAQAVGTTTLKFIFSEGNDQKLTINVSDTVPTFESMPVPDAPYFTMTNGGFENGLNAWGHWIDVGNTTSAVPEIVADAKEGSSSIMMDNGASGFTSMWNTTLPVNGQKNMPAVGDFIRVGAWVKVGADTDTSKPFTIQVDAADSSDNKTAILNTPALTGLKADTWVYVVSSPASIPAGTASLVTSFQNNMPGVIQVDDVRVFHYPSAYSFGNGGFESSLASWGQDNSAGAAEISVAADAMEGSKSVKLVNTAGSKASIWNSTLQMNGQEGMPAVGDVIQVGAWIKVGAGADTSKEFILKAEGYDGSNKTLISYITSIAGLKPDTWTFVLAPAAPVPAGQTAVTVAIEDSVTGTVQVDGIRVFRYPAAYTMANGNFESGTSSWGYWIDAGNTTSVAPEAVADAKEGSSSIKLNNGASGFTSMWNTTLAVNGQEGMPVIGDMIQIGAWVKLGEDADASKPFVIQVEADTGSNPKPLLIKTGSLAGIQANTWTYIVSGVVQIPAGTNALAVSFQDIMPGTIQIDDVRIFNYNPPPAVKSSTISPRAVNFDKNAQADVIVTMTLNDNTLAGIFYGEAGLVLDSDYTVSGSNVTIKKEYLASLSTGMNKLTFKFSAGPDQTLNINIVDTTPVNHAPAAATLGGQNIAVGQQARFAGAWLAADQDVGDKLSVTDAAADAEGIVTLSVSNGYLLAEGASEGSAVITATVTDSRGASVTSTFSIAVTAGSVPENTTPQALSLSVQSFAIGQTADYTGDQLAMDIDAGEILTVTDAVSGTPGIVSLSVEGGQLQITGAGVGTATVTATVKDSKDAQAVVSFDIEVRGFAYTMVSPGFEDYTTPDNDFSWGIYPSTLQNPWSDGIGIVSGTLPDLDPENSIGTVAVQEGTKALGMNGGALWQRVYLKDGVQDGDFVQCSAWVFAYPGSTGFKIQVDALDKDEAHTVISASRAIEESDWGKWVLLKAEPVKSAPMGSSQGLVIAANSSSGPIVLDDFVISRVGHETPVDESGPFTYPQRSVYPLQNGDFEAANTDPWGTWGTVSVSAEESYFGSKSVKFVNTDSTNTAIWQGASVNVGANDPKVAQVAEAGVWVYFASDAEFTGKDFYIDVNAVNAENVQTLLAKSDSITSETPKGKWIYIKTKPVNGGIIPEGTSYVQVSVQNTVTGTVYADLIQMGEKNAVNGNPTKMAFFAYQPWYGNIEDGGTNIGENGDNNGWYNWYWSDTKGLVHDPANIIDGKRDIASVLYPMVGAYDSTDTELLQYQFDIAKAAHIDGFMVNDYGMEIKQEYRANINKMFDIADTMGMKIALQYEPKIHLSNWVPSTAGKDKAAKIRGMIDDIEYILQHYAPRKSYLKYNGLPVINPFGASLVSSAEWLQIKTTVVAEGYGDFILMADTAPSLPTDMTTFSSTYNWHMMSAATEPSKGPTYDKVYDWAIGNDRGSYSWVEGDLENRFGVGLAFPGFNDWGVGGNWGERTERIAAFMAKNDPEHPWMGPVDAKGDTLTATQNALLSSKVNWIVYATFNDWNEATVIEPSQEFGYRFVIEVQNFMEQFKGLPLTEADDNLMQQITEAYIANRTAKFK